MLSFLQYISELFEPKTEQSPEEHPDYVGLNDEGQHVYRAGVGKDGTVETTFSLGSITWNEKKYPNAAEAEFSVNGSWKKQPDSKHLDPREIMHTVHSHFDHYIRTRKPDAFFYSTEDPVRHRIYQMAAKKYGVPAINYMNMKDGLVWKERKEFSPRPRVLPNRGVATTPPYNEAMNRPY